MLTESIYQFNHNSNFKYFLTISLAKAAVVSGNQEKTLGYLGKAAAIKIEENQEKYSGLIPNIFQEDINSFFLSYEPNQKINGYLKTLNFQNLYQTSPEQLAKVFYSLGLLDYETAGDEAASFWQTSVYLAPWWSYFHVELANYYLVKQQDKLAEATLEKCLTTNYVKAHCQMYLETNFAKESPNEVGFLTSLIEKEI